MTSFSMVLVTFDKINFKLQGLECMVQMQAAFITSFMTSSVGMALPDWSSLERERERLLQ